MDKTNSQENKKKSPIINVDMDAFKDKAAQAGEYLSDMAAEAKEKAGQAGEKLSDKTIAAKDKAAEAVKEGGAYVSDKAIKAKREYDLRRFKPLTKERLEAELVNMPEMIHIVDWDKRVDEPACDGAVAFNDGTKDMRAISILTENVGLMNASFYPDAQEGVYYRDPSNPNAYIDLNDYFDYLKKARVHELNQIAQDLGAKHIKVTLKAEKKTFVQTEGKASGSKGKKVKAEADHSDSNKQFESIEVVSEKDFKGHEAQMPELVYFKNEPDIIKIIERRMDKENPIYTDKEQFKYSNTSGIKRNDAVKIEGLLKKLKVGGNASISNEVENEERIFFEYQIEYPEA